jgi:hypothetical protein
MAKKKQKRSRGKPVAKPRDAGPRARQPAPAATDCPRPDMIDRASASAPMRDSSRPRAPTGEPVFWFGFEVAWAKLALGRFVLFALLAGDALLQIRHAPRYGAGGFNVPHFSGLAWLATSRVTYGVCELVNAYLFVLIACGVATRWLVPIAAVIYSWLYFGSQLDSYQHHYLVAMILVVACFVPWQRPVDARPETPVRSWALRLILVELAIVYLWAAISKLDPAWLNGSVLGGQLTGSLKSLIAHTVGFKVASVLVIVTELVLAGTVWLKPAWKLAAPLGILLHFGIVVSGLEIGLFAWLMIALYIFVVPDRIWIRLRGLLPWLAIPTWVDRVVGRVRWLVVAVALGGGVAVAARCHFDSALGVAIAATVAIALAIAALATWTTSPGRRVMGLAAVHLVALATWFTIDRTTRIAYDYYKFWGGTSRRMKDPETAEYAYGKLIAIAPDDPAGHYQLGRLLLDRGAIDDGLAQLHTAQSLDTHHARAYSYEARWLATHDRAPEALAKAREAAAAEPDDADAKTLLTALQAGRLAKPGRDDTSD